MSKFDTKERIDFGVFEIEFWFGLESRIKPCLATANHTARQRRAEGQTKICPCLADVDFRNLESRI